MLATYDYPTRLWGGLGKGLLNVLVLFANWYKKPSWEILIST
ncbi:hypothetical protein B6N60_00510 [Richelia sinica FACHB-800]|uniref:Uncharacterized protein n=1 Tax=Richelia sinica FACHB-800 TaxID=1357546 RepID=A0A975T475_9NOST|nr:hypothetical protein [Richelia sinica]QXE21832.1 hypothetical protein B6N60_00510 [Richelia sinica FACHB-800]